MVPSVQIARTQTTYSVIGDKESIVSEASAIELPASVGTEESSAVVNTYSQEAASLTSHEMSTLDAVTSDAVKLVGVAHNNSVIFKE